MRVTYSISFLAPKAELWKIYVLIRKTNMRSSIVRHLWDAKPQIRYYTIFLVAFDTLQVHTFAIPGVATNTMYVIRTVCAAQHSEMN